jgi:hypothetical protein
MIIPDRRMTLDGLVTVADQMVQDALLLDYWPNVLERGGTIVRQGKTTEPRKLKPRGSFSCGSDGSKPARA